MVATKFGTFLIKFGRTRRTFFRAAALFQKLLARRTFCLAALAAACGRTALSNPAVDRQALLRTARHSCGPLSAPADRQALLRTARRSCGPLGAPADC